MSFDHSEAGTPEQSWDIQPLTALPRVSPPGAGEKLGIVAAHPDDESLGAGGLIAAAAALGADISVIVASDGAASHPRSPTHTPVELAEIRRAEVRDAVARLAPSATVRFLHLPDGGLASVSDRLADALRPALKGCTLLVSPWAGDRHPDHAACATAVAAIAASAGVPHWQYPIWAWHWADPSGADLPWQRMLRVDLQHEAWTAKQAAMGAHRSQHSPLSRASGDEAILPPNVLAHFTRKFEVFVADASAAHAAYFDRLYAQSEDPWGLADRFYERRKRALLMASLPRPHFARVFEPGCASGEISVLLAERCNELVAWDGAASAVRQTQARLPNARVEQCSIPDDWPDGRFDLIVLSEVGYYCLDLAVLARRIGESLTDDGILVACHWRHPARDHPHTAEEVHAAVGIALHQVARHQEDDFMLEVWSRSTRSVASREGILP